ncbi:MAG: DegQ family serine endoprotease [Gammaproteobacteria bacterium]|nr:DegQ family serine endoprotease [Gammaproteobacteria bacterium]
MGSIRCRLAGFIFLICVSAPLAAAAAARALPDFTELVEENAAAVVNISTSQSTNPDGPPQFRIPNIPENSPFYEFFKKFFGQLPDGVPPFHERSSLGSGFIISADGYVITNNHVVAESEEVTVRLHDRREFTAKVIGTDERSDIAVLKISGEDLPSVQLGDSTKLRVGEWVLAIGSPFGFDHSVTAGIVSAMGRSLPNENYIPFIQTDVAINPGNSGGPLFNLKGEVVGVNSQIYSRTGGFMGLSFAVPINVVNDVYHQLRERGHVSRGWLGVLIQDVTRELAESFGMERSRGALVAKVLPDSPAAKAGVEVGDVIVRFNEQDVPLSSDLPPMVGGTAIDSTVPMEILRRGKSRTLQVRIAELPEQEQIADRGPPGEKSAPPNALQIVVRDLTDEEKSEFELSDQGILVQQVLPGPAANAGVRDGDVILLLNNVKITNVAKFEELANALPRDKSVPILVQRRGNPIFLAFRLSDDA